MVGRLNDTTHALTIGGYGTSPAWAEVYNAIRDKKFFALHFDSSGIGPSDHSSFYRKNIPVLFFSTGINPDYHKPGDNSDKINYLGEMQVVKYIYEVVENANTRGRVAFTPTRDQSVDMTRGQ